MFKRVIVGWKVSNRMDTPLVLDALNQALDARGRPSGVIHHSDKGSQYLSIKYGERLKQSGLAASVGTTGDSTTSISLRLARARRRDMLVVESPVVPTDAASPDCFNRSPYLIDRYWLPLSE